MGIVLPWIIDSEPLLQVRARRGELSQPEQDVSEHIVTAQKQSRIASPLGQDQELLPQVTSAP
jgi:hypothetical protein